MAGSKQTKNDNSSKPIPDSTNPFTKEKNEFLDDDVIDRLLMEDNFSDNKQIEATEQESIPNNMSNKQDNDSDDFDVDDLIDSVSTEAEIENDEFADEDEFNVDDLLNSIAEDPEGVSETSPTTDPVDSAIESNVSEEPEKKNENTDDDFLMADFDISADDDDDDELLESPENEEEVLEVPTPSSNEQVESISPVDNNEIIALQNKLNEQSIETTQSTEALAKVNTNITDLSSKVNQLETENNGLKELITTLTAATSEKDNSAIEEIDLLQKEHRKFKKTLLESETKTPVITYVVMAIAILALLIGGGLGAIGYGAQTDVESLTELVSTLEEEIEIITAKDTSTDVNEMKFKINTLTIQGEGINNQLTEINKKNLQPNTLKTVVDDLVVQNNHAQKAIEQLLAAVETLEQQKATSAKKRTVKKAKKIIPKETWDVNLVSFKQEWYAKRKAEEFEKKGISAIVERVKIDGQKWFRLRVKGFKSKYGAAAYAVKVKKTLNLSSVWVTKP